MVPIDYRYAAAFRFRDVPRAESRSFVKHMGPKHQFGRVMIVSGDRESEVRYLADQVRITQIRPQKSPKKSWTSSVKRRLKRRHFTWAMVSMTHWR